MTGERSQNLKNNGYGHEFSDSIFLLYLPSLTEECGLSYKTMFRVLTRKHLKKFSPCPKEQEKGTLWCGDCGGKCLLLVFSFLSSATELHCPSNRKTQWENQSLWPEKLGKQTLCHPKSIRGIPIIFFPPLSSFPTSLKGSPSYGELYNAEV